MPMTRAHRDLGGGLLQPNELRLVKGGEGFGQL